MSEDSLSEFAEALSSFQAEMPHIGKDQHANAGQYGYSYAGLEDIAPKVLGVLAKHGLSWTAAPKMIDGAFVLVSSLLHVGGHREPAEYPLPDPSKTNPQQIGSAITYARRYSFTALTGVTPGGEDDDGAKALEARSAPRQAQQSRPRRDARAEAWQAVADYAKRLTMTREQTADDYAIWAQGELLDNATADQLTAYAAMLKQQLAEAS